MMKRIGGLLYVGAVLAALVTGVQTLTAHQPIASEQRGGCMQCSYDGNFCWRVPCVE